MFFKLGSKDLSGKKPRVSAKHWLKYIEKIFCFYFCLKSAFYLGLECYYVNLQKNLIALQDKSSDKSQLEANELALVAHRLYMRQCGSVYRELDTAAIFGYASFLSILVSFRYADLFTLNRVSRLYRSNDTILGHIKPSVAKKRLRRLINAHIRQISNSNEQTVRFILLSLSNQSHPGAANKVVHHLKEQQSHLRELSIDKSTIWPANKTAEWRRNQIRLVLILYFLIGVGIYVGASIAVFYSQIAAYDALDSLGQIPLNLMEKISLCELTVAVLATGDPFISAVSVLIVSFHERVTELIAIKTRLKHLNFSLVNSRKQRESHGSSSYQTRMQREIDKEALEVYLCLRVFITELRPTILLANLIMNQCLVFVFIVLTLTLLFYSDVDTYQAKIVSIVTVTFILAINSALTIGAAFEAFCRRTWRHIWLLLANLDMVSGHDKHLDLHKRLEDESGYNHERFKTISLDDDGIINPHTNFLWHRLASQQDFIATQINCTILNMIRLNYHSLLRINFWFVSAVLIFLTGRKS